jgi:hypothetical protein
MRRSDCIGVQLKGEGSLSSLAAVGSCWWLEVVKVMQRLGDQMFSAVHTESVIWTANRKELFAPFLSTSQLKYCFSFLVAQADASPGHFISSETTTLAPH